MRGLLEEQSHKIYIIFQPLLFALAIWVFATPYDQLCKSFFIAFFSPFFFFSSFLFFYRNWLRLVGAGLLGALQLFSIMQTVVVVAEVMVEVVVVHVLVVVKT